MSVPARQKGHGEREGRKNVVLEDEEEHCEVLSLGRDVVT